MIVKQSQSSTSKNNFTHELKQKFKGTQFCKGNNEERDDTLKNL